MENERIDASQRPFCGRDLERWRIENGLTKSAAADAFGLQKAKWEALTKSENADKPLNDPVLAMLLSIYQQHPASLPMEASPDIRQFYAFLGLEDTTQDREAFATLVGRSVPSVYRLLQHDGKPGRPLIRWIEAVKRLGQSPKQSMMLMTTIATRISDKHKSKWSKQGQ